MSDPKRGLYKKYDVQRLDGSEKHRDCYYFVLDMDHDKFAPAALRAYAIACRHEYPTLAEDLLNIANGNTLVKAKAGGI